MEDKHHQVIIVLHRYVPLQTELAADTEVACWVRLALRIGWGWPCQLASTWHHLSGSWKIPLQVTIQRSLPRQIPSAKVLLDLKHYPSLSRNSSSIDGLSISRSRSSQGCLAVVRFLEKMLYSAHLNTPEPFCPHITSGGGESWRLMSPGSLVLQSPSGLHGGLQKNIQAVSKKWLTQSYFFCLWCSVP